MSLIRTFTVTVQSTGSGNKYFIDGVQQDTVVLAEGYTYKFDQSDSSNGTGGSHPLRFSTNDNNSPSAPYTTGVTTAGSPGSSGAYTQIEVAASAPQLYYYCTNHSGMGGAANTVDPSTYGVLQWGQNSWGSQDEAIVSLTGLSATASVGNPIAFHETGWGADTWGAEGWGGAESIILLPGFSLTSSVNLPSENVFSKPGWGTLNWGQNGWGSVESAVFNITGLSAATALGNIGDIPEVQLTLTGIEAETDLGTLSTKSDAAFTLTALSQIISSPGLLSLDEHSVGLTGLSLTSTVAPIVPDDVMGLTGLSADIDVGSIEISTNPIIVLSALTTLATTLGTVDTDPVTLIELSGRSLTSTQGNVTTTQLSNAFPTGLVATTSLNQDGIILKYYHKLTPKTSGGYTPKTPKTSTGYTIKTPA